MRVGRRNAPEKRPCPVAWQGLIGSAHGAEYIAIKKYYQ
ncbi:hypothetical protein DWUX_116 [Desulfovibrio diazotrophicus]|nr:hypothetical protein DWUX_116 [Desulfovibrio diazotrophicus]